MTEKQTWHGWFRRITNVRRLSFAILIASTSVYGAAVVVTDPSLIKTTDVVNWSTQIGGDQTPVGQTFFVDSTNYESIAGHLDNGAGSIVVAGKDGPSGNGISAGDDLLATNGNAPLTFYLQSPVYGLDAYIDTLGGSQFTARIQAFSGLNSVFDMSVKSDGSGDPLFLGVSDTISEITKVVYSLTAAPAGFTTGNFVLDTLMIQNQFLSMQAPAPPPPVQVFPLAGVGTAPEPRTSVLLGAGLLALALTLRRRKARL